MEDLGALESVMGYAFKDPSILKLALTHPSFCAGNSSPNRHNQRLEFLGDAVLELVLTMELYKKFPNQNEGDLTKARARMVNRKRLAELGMQLHLGDYILLSRGEEGTGGRQRQSTLADAFESIIGAVFIDGGWESARSVVLGRFAGELSQISFDVGSDNPKGRLQELLQVGSNHPPEYHIESVTGPDHARMFECSVFHNGFELGRGMDNSKKAAETQAASRALEVLNLLIEKGKWSPLTSEVKWDDLMSTNDINPS